MGENSYTASTDQGKQGGPLINGMVIRKREMMGKRWKMQKRKGEGIRYKGERERDKQGEMG